MARQPPSNRKTITYVMIVIWVIILLYLQTYFSFRPALTQQQHANQKPTALQVPPDQPAPTEETDVHIKQLEQTVSELQQQVRTLQLERDRFKSLSVIRKQATKSVSQVATDATAEYIPKPIIPLRKRNQLGDQCRKERFEVGIEIGVSRGQFAQQILKRWTNFKQYHLVDVWQKQESYNDVSNLGEKKMQSILQETRGRMARYGSKVVFHKNFSNVAVHDFKNESADFIYVDARHDYTGVFEDCTMFWPILKKGGIMAGHDYLDQPELTPVNGVMQDWTEQADGSHKEDGKASRAAVEDFSKLVNRQLGITYMDETQNKFPSWYLRK